jgi:hypothetical protein
MTNVTVQLDEQLSDLRSNEIAYRFIAENRGAKPIRLISLTSRVADGVTLLDVKDSSERDVRLNHKNLCAELTSTLKAYLLRIEQDKRPPPIYFFRSKAAAPPSSVIRDLGFASSTSNKPRTIDFTIQGVKDADIALTAWFGASSPANESPEKKLFEAKLTQLKRYEEQIEAEKKGTTLGSEIATLAGGSIYATTFVFSFARGMLEPRKYTIALEAKFQEDESEIVETVAASASTIISPRAFWLSCIAVVSSVLGAVLRTALHAGTSVIGDSNETLPPLDFVLHQLQRQVISLETLGGMVVALVIFNIYEQTEFGARVKMGVGWRSALLIGVLAGVFTDRLLIALAVFIGGPTT